MNDLEEAAAEIKAAVDEWIAAQGSRDLGRIKKATERYEEAEARWNAALREAEQR